jgi:hypothetical protein
MIDNQPTKIKSDRLPGRDQLPDLQPVAFGELFAPYKAGENRANLPKGEYSYRLSAHLKNPTTRFEVPPYLCDGLSWLMAIGQELHT